MVMCSYSECNATQTQYYTYYNVNDTRHTPKCSNCGTLNAQDHKMVESECACGYFDCGCADLTVSPGDAGGHWLSCKEHGRVYIAHTNTGSTNNGKCECGDFIIHSSTDTTNTNNGRFLNTIANMGDSFRLYVCADDKIFNNTSIRQAAVIDLCNRTVKNETSSGKMFTIGTSGVVIKDGKVELKKVNNNFIVVSANAGVTIEDIDITTFGNQSRTVITANAGCEITLKNVTVNGILITEENVATYINGAANATIRIENTTN